MVHGGRGGGGGGSGGGGGVRLGLQLHLLEPTDLGGEPGAQLVVRTLHGAEPVAALQSRGMKGGGGLDSRRGKEWTDYLKRLKISIKGTTQ